MRSFVVPCGVCVDESESTAINHVKNQLQTTGWSLRAGVDTEGDCRSNGRGGSTCK